MKKIIILLLLGLAACDTSPKPALPLAAPQQSGELVVLTHNGPTTYFEGPQGEPSGFEYDLVMQFAQQYGYRVRFVEMNTMNDLYNQLVLNQAHFIAAGLSNSSSLQKDLEYGPSYLSVTQEVIYNTDGVKPDNFDALTHLRIEVVAGSSHVQALRDAQKKVPGLHWTEVRAQWDEDLLERLAHGDIDAVVVDSNEFDVARKYYPNLEVAFEIPPAEQLAWVFPTTADQALYKQAQQFFVRIKRDGSLKRIIDRYYGQSDRLEGADVSEFLDKMRIDLPKFRPYFYQAQEETGLDWRLIAAISYQESHWDPYATSPTGVRGMMMLTTDTADKMDVEDRLDPKQSVLGGAKYLAMLIEQLPLRITEPDRTWMALAAYNQGQGHLEDARVLAQRRKLNPSAWCDVKQTMPLLSASDQFSQAKHGFCRGGEAVVFVENVRTYYDILVKYENPYNPLLMYQK